MKDIRLLEMMVKRREAELEAEERRRRAHEEWEREREELRRRREEALKTRSLKRVKDKGKADQQNSTTDVSSSDSVIMNNVASHSVSRNKQSYYDNVSSLTVG